METDPRADLLRHRQTKGAATDMVSLQPPRHIPTLPASGPQRLITACRMSAMSGHSGDVHLARSGSSPRQLRLPLFLALTKWGSVGAELPTNSPILRKLKGSACASGGQTSTIVSASEARFLCGCSHETASPSILAAGDRRNRLTRGATRGSGPAVYIAAGHNRCPLCCWRAD